MGNILEEFDFSAEQYKELCERMSKILTKEKELAAEKATVREALIELAGGERMENGIKLSWVEPTMMVDYKAIVESLKCTDEFLQEYKKPKSGGWRVTKY